jgi:acyl carrier protein
MSALTPDSLRTWVLERLAHYLEMPIAELDVEAEFADYGLTSVNAIEFIGEIEDLTGNAYDPGILWDYPTIVALVNFLVQDLA